jgi:cytochrome c peroxidase
VIAKIVSLPDYEGLFEASFGGAPTIDRLGQAIGSWERSLVSGDSPFDRWRYGRRADTLTLAQKRGLDIFLGKAGCASCHLVGDDYALFTDHSFHDTGVGYQADLARRQRGSTISVEIAPGVSTEIDRTVAVSVGEPREADLGRYEVTLHPQDRWRFKTPSLRNVALTGPYMHDGSLGSLEAVVRFYNQGGVLHEGLDPLLQPLGLTDDEVSALVTFLRALTASNIGELTEDARSAPIGN